MLQHDARLCLASQALATVHPCILRNIHAGVSDLRLPVLGPGLYHCCLHVPDFACLKLLALDLLL